MFTTRKSARFTPRHVVAALCAAGALACGAAPAHAVGVPGADLYMGAGLGQSNSDVSLAADFDKKDMGWKVFVGGRFLSMFGAELDYLNLGKASGGGSAVKSKGLAAFGMYYLPIPLPILDFYVKAGVARLDSDGHVNVTSFSTDDTKFAYGGGLQLKFGSWAIRSEYEKFKVDGAKPSMLSLGFSRFFL